MRKEEAKLDVQNKPYSVLGYYPEFGKTQMEIKCPWCGFIFYVYVWSFAGCGKRCLGCGSKHTMYGGARVPPQKGE